MIKPVRVLVIEDVQPMQSLSDTNCFDRGSPQSLSASIPNTRL